MEGDEGRDDDIDKEGSEGEGDGGDDEGGAGKQEYVKKEFVARPYLSTFGTDIEVKGSIIKNSRYYSSNDLTLYFRPLMKIRISRPRRDFGHEGISFIDREAGESNLEIKVAKTGYFTKKKVLEIGLQAANKMLVTLFL